MDLAGLPTYAAILVALAAGTASFLSPCVAPLLPGYLAFVAGSGAGEQRGSFPRAIGFVAGFTILFALLGATAATFSRALIERQAELELVSGLVVALLGMAMIFDRSLISGSIGARMQAGTSKVHAPKTVITAMPVGAAFAIAWSPCIGPALAAILTMAAGTSQPAWGAVLLVAYGIGLGVPFLAGALALDRVGGISRRLRRHARMIRITAGGLLVLIGLLIATGGFGQVTARLARTVPDWLV